MFKVFDSRKCSLGEGPLWHPVLKQLFWFDILNRKLLTKKNNIINEWLFNEMPSAAGWIDKDNLLICFENNISVFNLLTSKKEIIIYLEAENTITRSNDGRSDPWGGFWIGTMGKNAENQAGKIYRFFEGKLEVLFDKITVPNSISFSPCRQYAYFTDTFTNIIMRQKLDDQGWPIKKSENFIDLSEEKLNPDGSVVDLEGCIWNAQWGAGRCAKYSPSGQYIEEIKLPVSQVTCPSFGGENLQTLFFTSASIGLKNAEEFSGCIFKVNLDVKGQYEHRVILA